MKTHRFMLPALARIKHLTSGDKFVVSSRVVDVDTEQRLYVLINRGTGPERGQTMTILADGIENYFTLDDE